MTTPSEDAAPGFEVEVVGYRFRLLDADDREIVAYLWHPSGASPVTYPHFHLSSRVAPMPRASDAAPVAVASLHLPTGLIAFAAIVRLLISEVGIAPRRPDWQQIVETAVG